MTEEEEQKAKVLIFFGESKSGKTTLINAYINYILGINYIDDFRYKIINEKIYCNPLISQPNQIEIYNIKIPDGTILKIIDTPFSGDSVGIKRDLLNISMIKHDFCRLSSITCVCFVIQASVIRLNLNQRYIYNCFLDLFGDDVKSNFIFMFTFCDGSKPFLLDYLQSEYGMFNEIVPYIESPCYFKFNNSSIFTKDINNEFNKAFFNISMKNFKDFNERIKKLNKVSLSKSKDVLKERFNLERQVEILQTLLKEGLNYVSNIRSKMDRIKLLKRDLNDSKNFTRKVKRLRIKHIPINDRTINTCLVCNYSCHYSCNCKDDEMYNCTVMIGDKTNARCNVCKGKCHWSVHKNMPYFIVQEEVEETVIVDDLKKKYYDLKNQLNLKIQLIQFLKKDLNETYQRCLDNQDLITKIINRLKEIALNKSFFEHVEKFENIYYLEKFNKQKNILKDIYENKSCQMSNIKRFLDKYLENEKKIYDINETNFDKF